MKISEKKGIEDKELERINMKIGVKKGNEWREEGEGWREVEIGREDGEGVKESKKIKLESKRIGDMEKGNMEKVNIRVEKKKMLIGGFGDFKKDLGKLKRMKRIDFNEDMRRVKNEENVEEIGSIENDSEK